MNTIRSDAFHKWFRRTLDMAAEFLTCLGDGALMEALRKGGSAAHKGVGPWFANGVGHAAYTGAVFITTAGRNMAVYALGHCALHHEQRNAKDFENVIHAHAFFKCQI